MEATVADKIISGPKKRPAELPAPIMISAPNVQFAEFTVNFLIAMIIPPMSRPIPPPVSKANGKFLIGASTPTLINKAGIPIPTPVNKEPPKSNIPTREPSSIRANKKLWSYTIKVDRKLCVIICLLRHKNERTFMSGFKRYDEDFKQSLVNLYQTGKTQTELCKDYGVSSSALAKWIKQYSQVRLEDNTVLTAKQIQKLQKRNAQLEEENLILKKASAIFMQNSK